MMGRPREFDYSAALDVAMNAFWKQGYEALSVKALSKMLGITRSSFYNAFGTREALFQLALTRYFEQSPDHVFETAGDEPRVKTLLTRTIREICRRRTGDPECRGCLAVNSAAELCGNHADLGEFLSERILHNRNILEKLLLRAVATGEIDAAADTNAMAMALQNLLLGLNLMSKIVRDEDALWRAAEITLGGLGLLEE